MNVINQEIGKINIGSSLMSELVESQELNVFSQLLVECKSRYCGGKKVWFKENGLA